MLVKTASLKKGEMASSHKLLTVELGHSVPRLRYLPKNQHQENGSVQQRIPTSKFPYLDQDSDKILLLSEYAWCSEQIG